MRLNPLEIPPRQLRLLCALMLSAAVLGMGFHSTRNQSVAAALWVLGLALIFASTRAGRAELRELWRKSAERPWSYAMTRACLPMVVLALLNGKSIPSNDNYGIQLTAASVVLYGTPEFSRLAGTRTDGTAIECESLPPYPRVCGASGVYAATPAGMLFFLVPSFAVARALGADLTSHRVLWRLSKWTAAWLAGACLGLFFLVAVAIAGERAALYASAFLGLGSGLWSTIAQGAWSHGGVCFGLMLAVWAYFLLAPKKPIPAGIVVGLGWVIMIASRNSSAPVIALFALLVFRSPRTWVPAALTGALGLALLSAYYQAIYGSSLGPQVGALTGGEANAYSLSLTPEGIYGLLLSPTAGIFIYQVWLVFLLLPSRGTGAVSPNLPKRWKLAFLGMALSQLLVYGCFRHWHGQWCWGTRYLTEILPLLALALLPALSEQLATASGRRLAQVLAAVSFLVHLNGTSLGGTRWSDNFLDPTVTMDKRALDWSDPAFLYPIPRWLRGKF